MEKSSTAILILLENKSASPFSFVGIILLCIILSCVITLHDFYSCFKSLFQTLLQFFFMIWRWKGCSQGKKAGAEFQTPEPCSNENVNNNGKFKEVEMVMEKLGIFCDPDDAYKLQKRLSFVEIATLFEEKEPSLEEAKEAFHVFDENNDGFIDADELEKVLCSLGFTQVSQVKCQRMIRVFDDNGDGQIDFREFLKVVEHSFCWPFTPCAHHFHCADRDVFKLVFLFALIKITFKINLTGQHMKVVGLTLPFKPI